MSDAVCADCGKGIAAQRDDRGHIRRDLSPVHQPGKGRAFGGREMRAAERDQIDRVRTLVEVLPEADEILAVKRDAVGIRGRGKTGLGRQSRDMQQWRGGGGSVGGAQRLEVVLGRAAVFKPPDQRHAIRGGLPDKPAEHRPEGVVSPGGHRHVDDTARDAVPVEIDPGLRRPPGQGDTQIHKVGMFDGARTQNAVGIYHRIAFCPGDVLACHGAVGQKVGGAGEAGPCAHLNIGIGKLCSGGAEIFCHALRAPIGMVNRDGIHRRRHPHPAALVGHCAGKGHEGGAGIDAAVDMHPADVDQARGTLCRGHRDDDLHRDLSCLAMGPGEKGPVACAQT